MPESISEEQLIKKTKKTFKIYEGGMEKFSTQTTFQKPHEGFKSFLFGLRTLEYPHHRI